MRTTVLRPLYRSVGRRLRPVDLAGATPNASDLAGLPQRVTPAGRLVVDAFVVGDQKHEAGAIIRKDEIDRPMFPAGQGKLQGTRPFEAALEYMPLVRIRCQDS